MGASTKQLLRGRVVWVFLVLNALAPLAHGYCFEEAGIRQGVDPCLLRSIATVESALNPKAIRAPMQAGNTDGSTDYGLMQINTSNLTELGKLGITRESLLSNPCQNVHVGAWILARFIKIHGHTWRAVGAYNAKSEHKRYNYVKKVQFQYAKLCANH